MDNEILINAGIGTLRAASVENGRLTELTIHSRENPSLLGNIYAGRVVRVVANTEAAFVDIGTDQNGFLNLRRTRTRSHSKRDDDSVTPSINNILHEGQTIMVQVIADSIATKGVTLTTNISLTGQFAVYIPTENGVFISRRISNDGERSRLHNVVEALYRSLSISQGRLIIRSAATRATIEALGDDIHALLLEWQSLIDRVVYTTSPVCIRGEVDPINRLLRELCNGDTRRIMVDSGECYRRAVQYCRSTLPYLTDRLEHFRGPNPLFDQYRVETDIRKALMRELLLPSGGILIIDEAEAFTAIDVDTGSVSHTSSPHSAITCVNTEAALEIARQLRLRNIGGLIVVDFLDPPTETDRLQLMETLQIALDRDAINTRVTNISSSGIAEIRRQRHRASLRMQLTEPCPHCDASGRTLNADALLCKILRKVEIECKHESVGTELQIRVSQVAGHVLETKAHALKALEKYTGRSIRLEVATTFDHDHFECKVN